MSIFIPFGIKESAVRTIIMYSFGLLDPVEEWANGRIVWTLKFLPSSENYKKCLSIIFHNKKPMGHIAHLRKQFKSINTYDYIITLIKRRKKHIINFMRIYWFIIWRNLNPLHQRMICATFGWNLLSGSGEEDFLILSMYIYNYLPLEKDRALHLKKL